DEEEKQKVNKRVKEVGKKSAFCDTLVTIYGKKRRYLEQMPEGISKAETLIKMCEMLKIDKNKLFAIGDGFNDIEMLSFAHISACPAEAPDEVKAAADMIVKSAKEGAVADFIDYLFDSI
ncbi:MAG: HAD hydrolase family protein, partial [Clostridia bacterium]|nr:HAD hydrolase family protein [Clostridia bacterium]